MSGGEMSPRWREFEDQDDSHQAWDAFRSADMVSLAISFPDDGDLPHAVIKALAETKNCQFEDMLTVKTKDGKEQSVPLTQRRFRHQMQSAQDCGRMLRILRDEVNTMWERETIGRGADAEVTSFDRMDGYAEEWWRFPGNDGQEEVRRQNLMTAKERLSGWLDDVRRGNMVIQQNTEMLNRFKEEKHVVEKSQNLLQDLVESNSYSDRYDDPDAESLSPSKGGLDAPMLEMQGAGDVESSSAMGSLGNIGHIVGCLPLSQLEGMRSGLYTAMRGNAIVKHDDIEEEICDPVTGEVVPKCVFVVYYHGAALSDKILRFARAYGATIYQPPETMQDRDSKLIELGEEIRSREQTQAATLKDKYKTLTEFYQHAITLRKFIAQEKLIFYTLNKCSDRPEDGAQLENRTITRLRALVWVPKAAVPSITGACHHANQQCKDASSGQGASLVMVKEAKIGKGVTRPTFSPTNMFTEGFQAIVDGYGIPDYKEINPTIFATAMFPFLFGVMFGDLVHGTLMTIFAALLIMYEDKFLAMEERNEIFEYLFSGRYTIFVMGICATYMGLIYNEALSCSMDIFGSAYEYSYICVSSFGAGNEKAFPEFGGNVVAATEEASTEQYSAFGCTLETLQASDTCWSLLGEEKYFEQLPCGVSSPCSEELTDLMKTCAEAGTTTSAIVVKMEPFVVPAGHGEREFLPTAVGQPFVRSHFNASTASDPATTRYNAYKFGVDPVWRYSSQNIQFTNSLKMKMSVILGVSQMLVGIILKWFNKIHFEDYGTFCAVCIPELLFMTCTFGYMCFLIFLKWTTNYAQGQFQSGIPCYESCTGDPITGQWASEYASDGGCFREPPMIITTMIGMFMSVGAVGQDQANPWDKCKFYLFESQEGLQTFFLMIALICIPWLFAVQPVLVYKAHEKEVAERQARGGMVHSGEDSASDGEGDEPEDDGFVMGDVIVGQAIHAIEFILGAVSNTASYLRLWALSLAHSQLSEVFWEYIFKGYEIELLGGQYPGLASGSVPFIIVCYALFFCCTIAVLMVMESLSAFLHALRLQWVEFQNKFYSATGYKFHPLDFEDTDMPFDMEN